MSTWPLTEGKVTIGCDMALVTEVQVRLWMLTLQLASQAGAPVSTWPGSRGLLLQAQSSPE